MENIEVSAHEGQTFAVYKRVFTIGATFFAAVKTREHFEMLARVLDRPDVSARIHAALNRRMADAIQALVREELARENIQLIDSANTLGDALEQGSEYRRLREDGTRE